VCGDLRVDTTEKVKEGVKAFLAYERAFLCIKIHPGKVTNLQLSLMGKVWSGVYI